MKQILAAFFLTIFFLLLQCLPSTPTANDLEQVKKLFFQLRFNAAVIPKLRGKSDRELFTISCRSKRVDCSQVLELLKKEDKRFYRKLIGK